MLTLQIGHIKSYGKDRVHALIMNLNLSELLDFNFRNVCLGYEVVPNLQRAETQIKERENEQNILNHIKMLFYHLKTVSQCI